MEIGSVKILKTNMKLAVIGLTTFLASISLAQDVVNEKAGNSIKVDTRAPSTYQNCNCHGYNCHHSMCMNRIDNYNFDT